MSNVEWNNMLDKKVLGRAKSCQIETDEEWNARRYNNRLNYRRLAKLTPEQLKKKRDEDRCRTRIAKRRQDAKRHKLLPEHSDFSTDTGSWPFLTYIIRNKLIFNHDPFFHMMEELIG
jgi:hypothetical protein